MSPPPSMTREDSRQQQYVCYYYVNSAGRINGYYCFYRRTWFIWLVPNESPNVTELSWLSFQLQKDQAPISFKNLSPRGIVFHAKLLILPAPTTRCGITVAKKNSKNFLTSTFLLRTSIYKQHIHYAALHFVFCYDHLVLKKCTLFLVLRIAESTGVQKNQTTLYYSCNHCWQNW